MDSLSEIARWLTGGISEQRLAVLNVDLATAVYLGWIAFLDDDQDDYIMFDNAGDHDFTIWHGDALVESVLNDENARPYVHAYRLRGKEEVFRYPVWNDNWGTVQFIEKGVELVSADKEELPEILDAEIVSFMETSLNRNTAVRARLVQVEGKWQISNFALVWQSAIDSEEDVVVFNVTEWPRLKAIVERFIELTET